MGRKRIHELDAYKLSFTLEGDNKKFLDKLTDNYGQKYGPMLNFIINRLAGMPVTMRSTFINFCIGQVKCIDKKMERADECEKNALKSERKQYLDIARIINAGIEIEVEDKEDKMKKIYLKGGTLVIPADWIVVNEEEASNCSYAAVLECRNSKKYKIPHFIMLNNCKYANEYTQEFLSDFNERCCEAWPDFRKQVLPFQVPLYPDPDHPNRYLNIEKHLDSPAIGHFAIPTDDDCKKNKEEPPYGAVIVQSDNI